VVSARRIALLVVAALCGVGAGSASAAPVTCGQAITQNTRLDSDLNCFGTGVQAALFIGADGITLDLGGHTISSSRSIINDGHDNVTIRNGTLDNDDGPLIQNASGTRLRELRFQGIVTGLDLSGSDHTDVRRSEFAGAVLWMRDGSSWNTVAGNRFSFNEGAVDMLTGSDHNRVVDNTFGQTEGSSISLSGADDNHVTRNRMTGIFGGISLALGSDRNTIANNVVRPDIAVQNIAVGISVSDSSRNLIRGNVAVGNRVGLRLRSGAGNWLVWNRAGGTVAPVAGDDADGIRVEPAATGSVLAYNRADGAADDGIDVEAPGTFLRANRANDNTDLGIEAVPGIIDLGGNRAGGNGNPLECLNVACR
jgi:parallel beta-helix repeat protein/adhesin HecA-like repeat protein